MNIIGKEGKIEMCNRYMWEAAIGNVRGPSRTSTQHTVALRVMTRHLLAYVRAIADH